jgi:hypothetical protein
VPKVCRRQRRPFATHRKEAYVLTQRGLSAIETWCKRWNIKINEDKTQIIYFSHRLGPPDVHLTLNGQNNSFASRVKYPSIIFHKRITWRLLTEITEAKAFITFIRIYSQCKSQRLIANIKLTLHKPLIRSVMTYACPAWKLVADTYLLKLQLMQNSVLRTNANFPRCTPVRFAHGFQPSVCMLLQNKIVQATSRNHTKSWKWTCSRYRTRWSQRLKVGGGQAYDRSSD